MTAGLINKRNFEKANIEYRIMNIECRRNVFYLIKKTEQGDSTLRQSSFDIRHLLKFHTSAASG